MILPMVGRMMGGVGNWSGGCLNSKGGCTVVGGHHDGGTAQPCLRVEVHNRHGHGRRGECLGCMVRCTGKEEWVEEGVFQVEEAVDVAVGAGLEGVV